MMTAKPGSGRPAKPGDSDNNLRIVKMESALRIINTLAALAESSVRDNVSYVGSEQALRILGEIRREASEALQ